MEKERQEGVYRVIRETAYGEIAEKKSRFLAALTPVESEEEALALLTASAGNIMMQDITAMHICCGIRSWSAGVMTASLAGRRGGLCWKCCGAQG